MIPYMDLNEQVDADFARARRRARLRAALTRIRGEHVSNRLLSFDDVRRGRLVAGNRLHRGTRVVGVDQIVGSVGRWRDFDRSFLPTRASIAQRWKRIDRAFQRGEDLPPVELYKLEEAYFVVDGHHRDASHGLIDAFDRKHHAPQAQRVRACANRRATFRT